MYRFVAAALALVLTGCAAPPGMVRHVIIGFGVVSVPRTNAIAQVTVIKAFGAYGGTLIGPSCAIGYLSTTVTTIQPNANALIEIK